jgi:hypothetical protein
MPIYHQKIINVMNELGYSANDDGACFGIAMMAIQACVAGDMQIFNERLEFINTNQNLITDIKKLSERNKNSSTSAYEQKLIDVIAFFDGVELYHSPELHRDIFGKYIFSEIGEA